MRQEFQNIDVLLLADARRARLFETAVAVAVKIVERCVAVTAGVAAARRISPPDVVDAAVELSGVFGKSSPQFADHLGERQQLDQLVVDVARICNFHTFFHSFNVRKFPVFGKSLVLLSYQLIVNR